MKCAITGANGYVGSRVVRYFERRGWEILELGRRPSSANARFVPYTLAAELGPDILRGVDALVHCAYDFRPARREEIFTVNVDGSRRLFAAAASAGVGRIVLISSLSAYDGCASLYGQAKLAIEAEAFRHGGAAVRPGLVFGDEPGGMVGTLSKLAGLSPILPVIGENQRMYACHEDDLAHVAFRAASGMLKDISKPLIAASPEPLTFGEILRELGRRRGREPVLISLSWRAAWAALKSAEALGLQIGLRSDSLISLMNPDPAPDFGTQEHLGLRFRGFLSYGRNNSRRV